MKKLLLILALIPLFCSCSNENDSVSIDEIRAEEYKWIKDNIDGYWDAHYIDIYKPSIEESLYFNGDKVKSLNILLEDGVYPFYIELDMLNRINLVINGVDYFIVDIDKNSKILTIQNFPNLKKRSGDS